MATTKFSVITTGDNPSWHIRVKELPGKHTYKIAVTVAKALMQEVEGEEIVAVVESWKYDGSFREGMEIEIGRAHV